MRLYAGSPSGYVRIERDFYDKIDEDNVRSIWLSEYSINQIKKCFASRVEIPNSHLLGTRELMGIKVLYMVNMKRFNLV